MKGTQALSSEKEGGRCWVLRRRVVGAGEEGVTGAISRLNLVSHEA